MRADGTMGGFCCNRSSNTHVHMRKFLLLPEVLFISGGGEGGGMRVCARGVRAWLELACGWFSTKLATNMPLVLRVPTPRYPQGQEPDLELVEELQQLATTDTDIGNGTPWYAPHTSGVVSFVDCTCTPMLLGTGKTVCPVA